MIGHTKKLLLSLNGQPADPGSEGLRVRLENGSGGMRNVYSTSIGEPM